MGGGITFMCEVVIIGAGISGLSAGINLLKRDIKCLIIERDKEPVGKTYGGLLTAKTIVELELYAMHTDVLSKNVVKEILLADTERRVATLRYMEEIYLVDMKELEANLRSKFLELGGEFRFEEVSSIDVKLKEVLLGDGTKIPYVYLIGADGANGVTQQYVRVTNIEKAHAAAVNVPIDRLKGMQSKEFNHKVLIDVGQFVDGYFYCYPKDGFYTFGYFCSERMHGHIDHGKTFLDTIETYFDYRPDEADIIRSHVSYNIHSTEFTNEQAGIILIGDAGAFTSIFIDDSLYYAFLSGELASISVAHGMQVANNIGGKAYVSFTEHYREVMRPTINQLNYIYNSFRSFYNWRTLIIRWVRNGNGAFASYYFDTVLAFYTRRRSILALLIDWLRVRKYYERFRDELD